MNQDSKIKKKKSEIIEFTYILRTICLVFVIVVMVSIKISILASLSKM